MTTFTEGQYEDRSKGKEEESSTERFLSEVELSLYLEEVPGVGRATPGGAPSTVRPQNVKKLILKQKQQKKN